MYVISREKQGFHQDCLCVCVCVCGGGGGFKRGGDLEVPPPPEEKKSEF